VLNARFCLNNLDLMDQGISNKVP